MTKNIKKRKVDFAVGACFGIELQLGDKYYAPRKNQRQ